MDLATSNATSRTGSSKRSSKGLRRACLECKRRKLPNDLNNTHISSRSSMDSADTDRTDQKTTCLSQMGERLNKLEHFFEKFASRNNSTTQFPPTLPSADLSKSQSERPWTGKVEATASVSYGGDDLLRTQTGTSTMSADTLIEHPYTAKDSNTQQVLVAHLPSQHDADIIFESSNSWMILDSVYVASRDIYVNRDMQSYALDMAAVSQEPAVIVARTLLHLAVCINSLPPEFDHTRLENERGLEYAARGIDLVNSLIISSDHKMMTLHGLECLLLLAFYHMDNASLRQAWLIVRRGLSLGLLMGFHNIESRWELPQIPELAATQAVWRRLIDVDRYLGLHLRLPFGSEDYPMAEDAHVHLIYRSKINTFSRQIAELDRHITPHSYARALILDEELDLITKGVPQDFWDVPHMSNTVKSPECFATLEKVMVQLWHFEMKIFIHLPYLLRAAEDSRYKYSKTMALQASRNIVMRWFALRSESITQVCCRLAEIGVFIAAVTLTLDILVELGTRELSEVKKDKGKDFAMVLRLVGEMEKLATASPRERIAARSVVVLKKILSTLNPAKRGEGKARITIPYFGTLEVEFGKVPNKVARNVCSAMAKGKALEKAEQDVGFAFVGNDLWPAASGNTGVDWDVVFFDGLEDRDTDGNWVF